MTRCACVPARRRSARGSRDWRRCRTTLSDAKALERTVTKQTRVLIIGAGFIGLKCAEGLRDRAASVTVCDLADHAMSASLDADSAPILERHLAQNGVRLLLGNTVERFDGGTAFMQSGETVAFDVRVIAVEPGLGHKIQGLKNMKESYRPGIFDKTIPHGSPAVQGKKI